MTAAQTNITLSIHEDRTVTVYPDSAREQTAIDEALLAACDGSSDESGAGYSGPESRGTTRYWGTRDGHEWQVEVVRVGP